MKRWYVIEYVDEEGDFIIKQGFLEPKEAKALLDNFVSLGISASIHDLTPPQQDGTVSSSHEPVPELGFTDTSHVR